MFLLFHLLTGLVIGYLLADRFDDRRIVLPCMLGAILPDLVDKPLGYLVLGDQIGNGRIFFHTLLFLVLLSAVGALFLRTRYTMLVSALAIGVGSHQVLDLMWEQPQEWLYPFLGPFSRLGNEDWFVHALFQELQNPAEWVSGMLLCLALLPFILPSTCRRLDGRIVRTFRGLALFAVPVLAVLGLYIVSQGLLARFTPVTGWTEPLYNVLGGFVVILAALAVYRLSRRGVSFEPPGKETRPATTLIPER